MCKFFSVPKYSVDVEKAVNGCDSAYPKIVLAHNPKGAKMIGDQHQEIDLILSGKIIDKFAY